eukprot:4740422-Amphidinium_carterae.1
MLLRRCRCIKQARGLACRCGARQSHLGRSLLRRFQIKDIVFRIPSGQSITAYSIYFYRTENTATRSPL